MRTLTRITALLVLLLASLPGCAAHQGGSAQKTSEDLNRASLRHVQGMKNLQMGANRKDGHTLDDQEGERLSTRRAGRSALAREILGR